MKSYRSTRSLLADIENVLASNRPSFHHSPLEDIAKLLIEGRNYTWVGVYLTEENHRESPLLENARTAHPGQLAFASTRKKILVSMKIAGREIGHLSAESDRDNAFGADERVLLERVATLLARFLTGAGKYLVRRTTETLPAPKAAAA